MEQCKKIDKSLKERHGILHLLEKLKQEGITIDEMEEIGDKLRKSGNRALSPLVRRLWREKSGDLISKYTYLLDFFDDEVWIDQLIQIALRRRDLEDEGKAALLAALEEYGVDVSAPPLATLLARDNGPIAATLPRLLDQGEEGLVFFMEDFFLSPMEERLALVRELPLLAEPRILLLLEILLGIDDQEIRREVLTSLGRVRSSAAAALLHQVCGHRDKAVSHLAARSLRRLSFLGVETTALMQPSPLPPFHAAYASPFDSTGLRSVWISRGNTMGMLGALYLQIHTVDGVRAVWGSGEITSEEFARYLKETTNDDALVEVTPPYVLSLIQDALFRNMESGVPLPPEFYVWRRMFTADEIDPKPYAPIFMGYDLEMLADSERHSASSPLLLDDPCFAGWFLATGRVYDYAEEWSALEKSADPSRLAKGVESILESFCGELLLVELEQVKRRLLLTADFMQQIGRERELIERTIAAALSLAMPCPKKNYHPFLKRLALVSMDMAREALAEWYDPRRYDGEDDWE